MSTLQARVQPALDRQANSIPQEVRLDAAVLAQQTGDVRGFARSSGLLTPEELALTERSATELVRMLAAAEVSSETLTRAFLRRAGVASQLLNCCTELLASEAIARARELDAHLASTGKVVGPLHGLPMSFKEHIYMRGKVVHVSYVALVHNVEHENGLILDCLLECGVVPYCRTPQPQCVMHLETNSNIYGHTLNPYNLQCTPGGSSGGESALLAFRGSPLGVGGDIGGSIRGPAGACGLYGFKPTCLRIPGGTKSLHRGRESILSTMGPLGHTRQDMELWLKSVLATEPWLREPSILPLPWTPETPKSPTSMRVAIMWDDGVVTPLPPVTRALRQVKQSLETAGVHVVDWQPKDHAESWNITSSLYYMDGGESERKLFAQGGEQPLPLTQWLLDQPGSRQYTTEEAKDLILRPPGFHDSH